MNELSKAIIHKNQARVREKLALESCNSETIELFLELFCFLEEDKAMFEGSPTLKFLNSSISAHELEEWILPIFREDAEHQKTVLKIMLLSNQFSTMDRSSTFKELLDILANPLVCEVFWARLRVDGWFSEASESLNDASATDTIEIAISDNTFEQKIQKFFDYWVRFTPFKSSQYRPSNNEYLYISGEDTEVLFEGMAGELNINGIVKNKLASSTIPMTSAKEDIFEDIKYQVAAMVVEKDLWSLRRKYNDLMSYIQDAFDSVYCGKIKADTAFNTPQKSSTSFLSSSAAFFSPDSIAVSTPHLARSITVNGSFARVERDDDIDDNPTKHATKKPKLDPNYKLSISDVGEVSSPTSSTYPR